MISYNVALKAATLQQCMGTAERRPMWQGVGLGIGLKNGGLQEIRADGREAMRWAGGATKGCGERNNLVDQHQPTMVLYAGRGRLASVVLCPSKSPGHAGTAANL